MYFRYVRAFAVAALIAGVAASMVMQLKAATTPGRLSFTIAPLLTPDGDSEPAIAIGPGGTMAITGLSWLEFNTNLWTGPFGSTPTFRGAVDAAKNTW